MVCRKRFLLFFAFPHHLPARPAAGPRGVSPRIKKKNGHRGLPLLTGGWMLLCALSLSLSLPPFLSLARSLSSLSRSLARPALLSLFLSLFL